VKIRAILELSVRKGLKCVDIDYQIAVECGGIRRALVGESALIGMWPVGWDVCEGLERAPGVGLLDCLEWRWSARLVFGDDVVRAREACVDGD